MAGLSLNGGYSMEALINYMDNIEQYVNKTTELFYQNNEQQALECMPVLLDEILKMAGALENMENVSEEDKQELVGILAEALKAMEAKDYVLLADILQYDMIDKINKTRDMLAIN